jgi:hypothetical protein
VAYRFNIVASKPIANELNIKAIANIRMVNKSRMYGRADDTSCKDPFKMLRFYLATYIKAVRGHEDVAGRIALSITLLAKVSLTPHN